jgi:hypothetical protein
MQKIIHITLCVAASLLHASCLRDSYWVKLSGPVSVSSEWVEFRPQSPLKAEKTFQNVVLELEPPFKYDLMREGNVPDAGKGILMPGGEVVNPEIEVIDQYGNTFSLIWSGATGAAPSPTYSLPYPNELPRDRVYTAVRLRSPKPIKCQAVYWFNESSKDWH